MAYWFGYVFNVVCRKPLSSLRCRSELIDFAWVVIVSGQKMHKKCIIGRLIFLVGGGGYFRRRGGGLHTEALFTLR